MFLGGDLFGISFQMKMENSMPSENILYFVLDIFDFALCLRSFSSDMDWAYV